ncbi:acetylglutamate kinase, partial [bacterium]|nr:acetylglutamate kinase [bacterium]
MYIKKPIKSEVDIMNKIDEKNAKILVTALPYIKQWFGKTIVLKLGGSAMHEPRLLDSFARDIALLKMVGMKPIIVHGGGRDIDDFLSEMGIKSIFKDGIRVTDENTMRIVQMVLLRVNQQIVSSSNRH